MLLNGLMVDDISGGEEGETTPPPKSKIFIGKRKREKEEEKGEEEYLGVPGTHHIGRGNAADHKEGACHCGGSCSTECFTVMLFSGIGVLLMLSSTLAPPIQAAGEAGDVDLGCRPKHGFPSSKKAADLPVPPGPL